MSMHSKYLVWILSVAFFKMSSTFCSPLLLQVRTLGETVRLDARTKLLNPKWYEGMLGSGYEGVREIQKRLTNTMGWSATSGMVDNWVYDEANSTFIEDDAMAKVSMARKYKSHLPSMYLVFYSTQ